MFRRDAHRAMEPILHALDAGLFERHGFALGGATRIALALGEVRESRDLDFVGADAREWSELRAEVRGRGYAAIFRDPTVLDLPREPTIDRYGIRFPVRAGERTIKVEIIHEGRIPLGPAVRERECPVPCLAISDCFAEKLLANSDRGADDTHLDRDLIDLALLREHVGPIPDAAWTAVTGAYGPSVREDLVRGLTRFRGRRRDRAFAGLGVDDPDRVQRGIELLAADLGVARADDEV
jgi:hypothetical protein